MPRRRRPVWYIQPPDEFQYAFFISHVREDVDDIKEFKNLITAKSGRGGRPELQCFLDVHNWPSANELGEVIKRFLLKSEYLVVWITPDYLANTRGWVWLELAYAELIQSSMKFANPSGTTPFIVPIFRNVAPADIEGTPLWGYWQRNLAGSSGDLSLSQVAQKLVDFYDQEALHAARE